MLEQLVADGMTVVFITHKLDEILDVTDRVTVLRDGAVVGTVETAAVTDDDLAEMMVGREVVLDVGKKAQSPDSDVVFEGVDLLATDERGQIALDSVSIQLSEGEILGIAGVSGNGQRELGECLAGVRDVDEGQIRLRGDDITDASTREVIDRGVSLIPEDRLEHGVVPDLDLVSNAILKTYWTEPIVEPGLIDEIDYDAAREYTQTIADRYEIERASLDTPVKFLSGGNIQRLIVGREVERNPDVLIANQPTRGVDIGAIEYIREVLIDECESGTAVLLISESLDEVLSLSDRVLVMSQGEVVHETSPADTTPEEIGLHMTGGDSDGDTAPTPSDEVARTDG
jgi:simple sugar transport system ATP-binding protein